VITPSVVNTPPDLLSATSIMVFLQNNLTPGVICLITVTFYSPCKAPIGLKFGNPGQSLN